jgi:hypothetical protein
LLAGGDGGLRGIAVAGFLRKARVGARVSGGLLVGGDGGLGDRTLDLPYSL